MISQKFKKDLILSENFKKLFKNSLPENQEVFFDEYTAVFHSGSGEAYLPNQAFLIAAYLLQEEQDSSLQEAYDLIKKKVFQNRNEWENAVTFDNKKQNLTEEEKIKNIEKVIKNINNAIGNSNLTNKEKEKIYIFLDKYKAVQGKQLNHSSWKNSFIKMDLIVSNSDTIRGPIKNKYKSNPELFAEANKLLEEYHQKNTFSNKKSHDTRQLKEDFHKWLKKTNKSGSYSSKISKAFVYWNDENPEDIIDNTDVYDNLDFFHNKEFLDKVIDFFTKKDEKYRLENDKNASTWADRARGLQYFQQFLQAKDIFEQTDFKGIGINKIYYGAPGTGKSYAIGEFINNINKSEIPAENEIRTTLHPEYSYHDFVGQIMPTIEGEKVIYTFQPQVFTQALERAFSAPHQPVFLILEELSRANVASVFGDLFQLLDRKNDGSSEYQVNNPLIAGYLAEKAITNKIKSKDDKIYIPSNLYIIGTANLNDQNVFVMDTAFKRRFEFEYIDANELAFGEDGTPKNDFNIVLKDRYLSWIDLFIALNSYITDELSQNEDKQLGQFFIKFKRGAEHYEFNFNQIKGKLLQYLFEDVQSHIHDEKTIFCKELNTFSAIYNKFSKGNEVEIGELFAPEFLTKLDIIKEDHKSCNEEFNKEIENYESTQKTVFDDSVNSDE